MSRKTIDIYNDQTYENKTAIISKCNEYLKNSSVSLNDIADYANGILGTKLDRKSIRSLMDKLEIPKRDEKLIKESKIKVAEQYYNENRFAKVIENLEELNKFVNGEELLSIYKDGNGSIKSLSKKTGVSEYYIKIILKELNNDSDSHNKVIDELYTNGIKRSDVEKEYLNDNSQAKKYVMEKSENLITDKVFFNIIQDLNIKEKKVMHSQIQDFNGVIKYGNGFSAEYLIDQYVNQNKSLQSIFEDTNVYPYTMKDILKENNIEVKRQLEISDVLKSLAYNNIDGNDIYNLYITENYSLSELSKYLTKKLELNIGYKMARKVVLSFNIQKEPKDIKRLQSNKSLSEKAYSYSMLKKAGFNSTKELADFYIDNSNLTYSEICELLNKRIGKNVFTPRWLGRHMAKEIAEENKAKVSISEKSLVKYIKSIYSGKILLNNYNIISPKELDIYIPDLNIAIEFNGLYWHSDKFIVANHNMTSYDYHYHKWNLCRDKGIQLLFVWEDDWEDDKKVIKKSLLDVLDNKILNPKFFRLE